MRVAEPDVELAMLGWVHWFNTERIHGTLDDVPPVELEAAYVATQDANHPVGIQQPESPSNPGRFTLTYLRDPPRGRSGAVRSLNRLGTFPN